MLKILYKRYYREVYILYLLCFALFEYSLWYSWDDNTLFYCLFFFGTGLYGSFAIIIPMEFPKSYRNSYGQKACKNRCIVVENRFYSIEHKCEHREYCPYSVHKYQHKVFKHMRIFKNKFLGW